MPSASSHSCLSQGSIKASGSSSCLTVHNVPSPVLGSGSSMPQGALPCLHRGSVWGEGIRCRMRRVGLRRWGRGELSISSKLHTQEKLGNNNLLGSDLSTYIC